MTDNPFLVDQEGSAESYASFSELDIVGLADLMLDIGDQGIGNLADTTFIDRSVTPCDMGELGVYRATDDLNITLCKFVIPLGERNQLGRTDKGK